MKKIIIDDAVVYAEAMFKSLGEVILIPGKDITASTVKEADALIVRSRTQVNASLLKDSRIQFVGSTVVGLDHIDQQYLAKNNIHFYSAQGCNANSVSEYVITTLYDLAEKYGFELSEKSLAIIGVGHVGKLVESKARAIGMKVLLNDPPRAEKEDPKQFVDLQSALQADIISFHTPLTFSGPHPSHHLLNKNNFNQIGDHTIIINAARGGIIDETCWLNHNSLANIIDCWENEPNINPELYAKASLATPHIAGHALDAKIKGSLMVYKNLCHFWKQPYTDTWQSELPLAPTTIQPNKSLNKQQMVHQILNRCYRPQEDDFAIRAKDINDIHKKFEYYRRHYPAHREWSAHTVYSTKCQTTNELLSNLGFKVIAS